MSRVTEIRYVGYGVEDFDAERKFYGEDWGLIEVAAEEGLAWFKTHGHDEHHVVRIHKSDSNCIEVIALAADSRADVDDLQARVEAAGCRIVHEAREPLRPVPRDDAVKQEEQLVLTFGQRLDGWQHHRNVPLLLPPDHGGRMLARTGQPGAVGRTGNFGEPLGPAAHGTDRLVQGRAAPPGLP